MQNGLLFSRKHKQQIDTLFCHICEIEKAVAEAKADTPKEQNLLAGTNLVSRPTEAAAIKELSPVRVVYIKVLGEPYKVFKPESWLEVFCKCCELYSNTVVMQIIKSRYIDNEPVYLDRVNRERLEKFLSDAFILAIQKGLKRVEL